MPVKTIRDCVLLYIEDDDATVHLFQLALRKTNLTPQFFRVENTEEAHEFLNRNGRYREAPQPDLVLLDLNLTGADGFDLLKKIKCNSELSEIQVVVFSSSSHPAHKQKAKALGADDYITKGATFDAFIDVAKAVCQKATAQRVRAAASIGELSTRLPID